MRTYELFINGEFIPNGDREMLQVINPATEEVISEVPKATAADVEAAIDAAAPRRKSGPKRLPSYVPATSASWHSWSPTIVSCSQGPTRKRWANLWHSPWTRPAG